ncbi:tetratricopeptide repeat protein [Marinobacterium sp. xm-a-121]|uniref:tetratricopeptide repeat protein n=1 Tax=unclassified Marinobacterium TaxID=2644139 RepID=UPI0015699F6A|nr:MULTISPECIES: tetratricopeptide repeat protein [unclassified Marinobacterium]NRP37954.1 tetratricopeptide repeat protein [Marinobacterium sp. xm-a-121]NRP99206.1 tetratricopeptide repeat protein [Marinobacterium sp. xm-v-233]
MRSTIISSLALSALLAGCTSTKPNIPSEQAEPNSADSTTLYTPGELNQESLLDLISAELYGQNREFAQSQALFYKQAQLSQSPELAERATRISQFMRDAELVEQSATLWQTLDPNKALPFQILLNLYFQEGKIDQALELLASRSEFSAETYGLIESHRATLQPTELNALFDLLQHLGPEQQQKLPNILLQARIQRSLQQPNKAIDLLDQGLAIDPNNADLTLDKARIIGIDLEEIPRALDLMQPALIEHTDHRELQAFQIRLLLIESPDQVPNLVESAINESNEDPQLIYYYALLLLENELLDPAERWIDRLIAMDPENSDIYLYKGAIEQQRGNTEAALNAYGKVKSGDNLLNAFARTLELIDPATSSSELEVRLTTLIKQDPERIEPLTRIAAEWLLDQQRNQEAIDLIDEQLKIVPQANSLIYAKAIAFEPIDPEQMLINLELALSLDEENPSLKNALGYSMLLYSDDFERAFNLIKEAYQSTPDDPAVIDSMGWAFYLSNNYQEALIYIEQAFKAFPDPEVAKHYIQVLAKLERIDEAKTLLDTLLQDHPENRHTLEAEQWLNSL